MSFGRVTEIVGVFVALAIQRVLLSCHGDCWCVCSSSNPACPPEPPVMPSQREEEAVQSVYGLSECYQLNCEDRDER